MSKIEDVKKDIKKFSALATIAHTDGGMILIESLQKDIVGAIDELSGKYKTASHIELITICARLGERLSLLRGINRATKNKKLAKEELEFLLQEEI